MSPDAGDASPSPEPGTEQDPASMTETKPERTSSEEKSPAQQLDNAAASANNNNTTSNTTTTTTETKPKANAKDPSRPRRKKARRACFACQRAHLTCGDERPCLRCIKRGLQDQCHDGVRKKAKYLHDAPAEALMPGFAGHYHVNGNNQITPVSSANHISTTGLAIPQSSSFMASSQPAGFTPFNQPSQISPALIENNDISALSNTHNNTTPRFASISNQNISPSTLPNVVNQDSSMGPPSNHSYDSTYIDPTDPSLFNFNISDLNFGNHYGALEFGMLGHMSAAAVGTPDVEAMNSLGSQSHHGSLSYESGASFSPANNFGFNSGFTNWQSVPNAASRHGSVANVWSQNNGMDAFPIGELSGQSPHSQTQEGGNNGMPSPENQFSQPDQDLLRQSLTQGQRRNGTAFVEPARNRRKDASDIYTSVTAPYPYTQGFHALTAFLQKRYPSSKTLKIAKALASIRPSFISCNKSLNNDDLIFMEKCFQRTLWEYEDFIGRYGTPTIICRRTGEVAAASKEFSLVTGWRRDVLLGKEPNLNVNTGSGQSSSGTQTGNTSRGAVTPRMPHVEMDTGRPQPVFLAELMDEDSVVQFYEDFAELAFGASRAAIVGQQVDLLKYKTKQDPGWGEGDLGVDGKANKRDAKADSSALSLGDKDGRVPCQVCWTVKRDVFDIPMLIVMNVLPII